MKSKTAFPVLLFVVLCLFTKGQDFAVVSSPSSSDDKISNAQAAAIFLGITQYWRDGKRIRLVLPDPTTDVFTKFSWEILGRGPSSYERHIRSLASSQRIRSPIRARSEEQVITLLIENDGSVGFVGGAVMTAYGGRIKKLWP